MSPSPFTQSWGKLTCTDPRLGGDVEMFFDIKKSCYLIGRDEDANDYAILLDIISHEHLSIQRKARPDGSIYIMIHDKSSNGTFVSSNGAFVDEDRIKRGKRREIKSGDMVMLARAEPPLDGDSFSRTYNLLDSIGKGGFGVVKLARHCRTNKIVAIKIIPKEPGSLTFQGENDVREARLLSDLQHPNIVEFIALWNSNSERCYYVVMEYVSYGDLNKLLHERKRLKEEDAQAVMIDMCDAIRFLHSRNIVHRDIKPANILIASMQPLVAKLADFGLAKAVPDGAFLHSYCGTVAYMAPEVKGIAGLPFRRSYDEKVDSWSLGVTLFLMLTGELPFMADGGENRYQIKWSILRAYASECVKDLIVYILRPNPAERVSVSQIPTHTWLLPLWQEREVLRGHVNIGRGARDVEEESRQEEKLAMRLRRAAEVSKRSSGLRLADEGAKKKPAWVLQATVFAFVRARTSEEAIRPHLVEVQELLEDTYLALAGLVLVRVVWCTRDALTRRRSESIWGIQADHSLVDIQSRSLPVPSDDYTPVPWMMHYHEDFE
ncbi:kinase-like protein [Coniophora puteana RWD-64-598 SS2]|uniref:Kinase-like protein n=1 Tax=Coniophora puteana (strain RWD-64-598) TaxID=741705 RepID=A0A5M3MXC7_CONPW|nr:kinase-like protein [Coniophora puteana RWD-64-598 SS2]EIW83740.1 kinase-like protein [Coniophora puteana RWD-64-598 SS2]